jgi:alkylresorcinol/alkylpyrone synthase
MGEKKTMSTIRSLATALPPYQIHQSEARQFSYKHFGDNYPNIEHYLPVFTHAEIDTRSFVVPAEWFDTVHSFKECNDIFISWSIKLGQEAIERCLQQAGLTPGDIDHLFFVSTTGLAAPSIDAHLFNTLEMNPHTRRTPVWGLGCAGGVAGLSRAYEYTQAFPQHRAMLLCVELCSITFQWGDASKRNLIATALFSDGAAAVLVEGEQVAQRAANNGHAPIANGPYNARILGTRSMLWPNTLPIMGWDIVDTGMEVVFSSRIPSLVQDLIYDTITEFLAPYNLTVDDMSRFIFHPGGAKVIRSYERALAVDPERMHHVHEVLRQYGNMSSPTVFFVYEASLKEKPLDPGEYGLLVVLGPGFSCEMALIQG